MGNWVKARSIGQPVKCMQDSVQALFFNLSGTQGK